METERAKRLADFVKWVSANILGDEKGEAQVFLDRLFQAFGHAGVKEAGATLEERVKKADGKGTSFADLVWKPVVLVEMKKRGEDLTRHYRQAFDYWTRLVPGRPRYVILCNFDEFWVYDFDTQMDAPVDRIRLCDLSERWGALGFLFPTPLKPIFGNDQVAITRKAADQLAHCFNRIVDKNRPGGPVDRPDAQRFVLQMLVALFAEDIGILPRYRVAQLLDDCKTRQDSRDLIGGLFEAMNTPKKTPDDRYQGVDYFNGGLFAEPARLELRFDEVGLLKAASREDWSQVRPEIFGTLFEHSLGQQERHAFGAHFTHPTDIMKIVGPTIVDPWHKLIEGAGTLKRLRELWQRMQDYRVLDPACGSGNFLYIAYRELKRLEARILERMTDISGSYDSSQMIFGFVSSRQFFGIDINPFAVELAKVTMMIARKLAIDELHITEHALPLDNLDDNFKAADALIDEHGNPAQWPRVDVIIGNPPFLGAKRLKPERGTAYVNAVRRAYPEIPGMADYCVYWIRKAHDHLPPCTQKDPLAGHAGLVGTQNIRNNQSRVGGLDHVVRSGTIVEAVDNQPWSGEANVHVSIANWVKTKKAELIPSIRLWTRINKSGTKRQGESGTRDGWETEGLVFRDVASINSALSDETDLSTKATLQCNRDPKRCFQGKIPGYNGFVLDRQTAKRIGGSESDAVMRPYLTGRELLAEFRIDRWIIDFGNRDINEASAFRLLFAHCQEHVLPSVEQALREAESTGSDMVTARREHLSRWWQLWNRRDELTVALKGIPRYIGCSRVTRRPVMVFLSSAICPSDAMQAFALADDYSFGILQGGPHFEWFRKSSKLKVESDMRYSVRDVFETYPWPQSPADARVRDVAEAGRRVRSARDESLMKTEGGLRAVYRLLELPGKNPLKDAQKALDEAVMAAYGFSIKKDILTQLLALNLVVAERERSGEPVTPPGIPPGYPNAKSLVSNDCIGDNQKP